MDPANEPLQGAPRHMRKPRFSSAAAPPRPKAGPSPGQASESGPKKRPKTTPGTSHRAKRRIALALFVVTLLTVAALIIALLLWQ
ncbi:MAG: hypothetical protein JWQ75_216 [Pseudarthrobacter sp.]|nr:hypothetical protein [Pseudarthrobacter sp.]